MKPLMWVVVLVGLALYLAANMTLGVDRWN